MLHTLTFKIIMYDFLEINKRTGLKAYVSQEVLNWHSLRHSHSAEF